MFKKKTPLFVYLLLFLATFLTSTIAGTQWAFKDYTNILNWHYGLTYAILIMTFLLSHEMGHYIAARLHKIDATLPFFIPVPVPDLFPFGTFGAVIKTRTPIPSNKVLFDIGVSGPIAGFIVCVCYLIYGLTTLPTIDFIYQIHPEYLVKYGGKIPDVSLHFGDTLLYHFLSSFFANPRGFLPPMNEIYHYPFLNVGWFGLFVTTMNMLPFGQLDGGHVIYAMFGRKWQGRISRVIWWLIVTLGFGTLLNLLYIVLQDDYPYSFYISMQNFLLPILEWIKTNAGWYFRGWGGWLFWGLVARFYIKLDHPPVFQEEKLDSKRMVIGMFALLILILCFSYNGIYFVE
jgi:membrane-associated protease RseP (regulator of RpoE activity)